MWAFKRSMCKHNVSGTTKTFLELADIIQWNNNPVASLVDWPKSGKNKLYAPHREVNAKKIITCTTTSIPGLLGSS